jgi:ribosome maturation factor RimP
MAKSAHFIKRGIYMNLELIKERILPILDKYELELISIKTKREFGFNILEIIVDKENVDVEYLSIVNMKINDEIDDLLSDNYYLEVGTPGAERELKTIEEAKKNLNKYVCFVGDKYNSEGYLEDVKGDILYIKVNLKGRFKVIEVPFSELSKLKTTVKV